ncbi:hypothetical protein DER44DRAFT_757246 [Fusarium oxysporum]|nr:hypothetical protein DER44DRAFT_757246 [Fusarium oxysporum]
MNTGSYHVELSARVTLIWGLQWMLLGCRGSWWGTAPCARNPKPVTLQARAQSSRGLEKGMEWKRSRSGRERRKRCSQ